MDQLERRAVGVRHPAVAPAGERDDDGIEVAALLGETVLVARRPLLVGHALEDAVLGQLLQAIGEAMARGAEVGVEVLEAAHAEEGVAQDEERPAVADDRERAGDRAGDVPDVPPAHGGLKFQMELASQWGPNRPDLACDPLHGRNREAVRQDHARFACNSRTCGAAPRVPA
jgi:hypothetical protein